MKVLITGTSNGIGRATAIEFLARGHIVYGLDILPATIESTNFIERTCDVSLYDQLPEVEGVQVLINNAGTIDEAKALATNLEGYINVTEKYAYQPCIKAVVNVCSISGHVGIDGPRYSASQGGRLAYTKNLAMALAQYGATVNSISPGAVRTSLEPKLYARKELMQAVAGENLLRKWIAPAEVAELIYYVAVVNKSITGQDILIDNGEVAKYNFISGDKE